MVRVLDVYHGSRSELVVLSNLVGPQIIGTECHSTEIELCNLHDRLLSLMFHGEIPQLGWRSWLLVLDLSPNEGKRERIWLVEDLWTSENVIIRNDRRALCAISPTRLSANGRHREWLCKVWDLEHPTRRPTALQIPNLAVGELGQGLVFEVFNGYLYAVSTQAPYELEEPEWTSYYSCFRFPLNNPDPSTLETHRIWRRHHKEGPINDLWTDLSLHKDEFTGEIFIVEARKEWTGGSSVQKRTWYRQTIPSQFSSQEGAVDDDEEMVDISSQSGNSHQDPVAIQPQRSASSGNSDQDPPYLFARPPDDDDESSDAFARALGLEQRPGRLSHNTHSEYPENASAPTMVDTFILAKTKYRAYNPSATAFLDLVVDDRKPFIQSGWLQQIRLRIGSRREVSPLDQSGMIHGYRNYDSNRKTVPNSERRYEDRGIRLWPPVDAPTDLKNLLNGDTISSGFRSDGIGRKTLGDIIAISDERSIVYLVKEKGAAESGKGRLVLVNFDEQIRFIHGKWAPEFIDLYGHENADLNFSSSGLAEQATMDGMLRRSYEPMVLDTDGSQEGDIRDEEIEDEIYEKSGTGRELNLADDVNANLRREEHDDNEPLDLSWLNEEWALWADVQKGFRFV